MFWLVMIIWIEHLQIYGLNRVRLNFTLFLVPGVNEFLSSRQNEINLHTPPKYVTDLDKEDLELIHGNKEYEL